MFSVNDDEYLEKPSQIKDWAIGSFWKYGDQPFRIVTKKDGKYLVEWKIRKDGFLPVRCWIEENELMQAAPDMLSKYK